MRQRLSGLPRRSWLSAGGPAAALWVMNTCFCFAIDHIPLGAAVTIEVLEPLVLSVVIGSRRAAWLWALMAFVGVAALGTTQPPHIIDPIGIVVPTASPDGLQEGVELADADLLDSGAAVPLFTQAARWRSSSGRSTWATVSNAARCAGRARRTRRVSSATAGWVGQRASRRTGWTGRAASITKSACERPFGDSTTGWRGRWQQWNRRRRIGTHRCRRLRHCRIRQILHGPDRDVRSGRRGRTR